MRPSGGEGGGGRSKQDVCDWNPESPLLRTKNAMCYLAKAKPLCYL
jgi:hypothetical protein